MKRTAIIYRASEEEVARESGQTVEEVRAATAYLVKCGWLRPLGDDLWELTEPTAADEKRAREGQTDG